MRGVDRDHVRVLQAGERDVLVTRELRHLEDDRPVAQALLGGEEDAAATAAAEDRPEPVVAERLPDPGAGPVPPAGGG